MWTLRTSVRFYKRKGIQVMKKLISILMVALMLLLCVGCETSDPSSSNYSSYSSPPSVTVPSYNYDFDFEMPEDDGEDSGITVYVSRSGKIHNNPRCSGMKYYTEMDYNEAVHNGYDFCKNCY